MNAVLLTAKAVSQLAAGLALAPLIDTHMVLLIHAGCIGVILCQILFILPSLQHLYYAWFAGRVLVGVSTAPLLASGLAILQARFKEKEKRGRIVGYAMTGGSLGVVVGPILGGTLYSASPYAPFAFSAGLALIGLGLAFCLASRRNDAGGNEDGDKREGGDNESVVVGTVVKVSETEEQNESISKEAKTTTKKAEKFPFLRMIADTEVLLALLVIVLINADITMLESTLSVFLHDPSGPFGLSVAAIGMIYWSGLFELAGSISSGHLGNALGGWLVVALALIFQGFFTALGPKDILAVTIISISLQGIGFGLADSCSNTIISLASDERFDGTGSVFSVASACNQLGAIVGPVGVSASLCYTFDMCVTREILLHGTRC